MKKLTAFEMNRILNKMAQENIELTEESLKMAIDEYLNIMQLQTI
jgi:hypothetical protein